MTENHREFSRVPLKIKAALQTGDISYDSRKTRDLSMNGIFIDCEEEMDVSGDCMVTLSLEGVEPPVDFQVKGSISRCFGNGVAIEFSEIPLESYQHLQNLVMLNSKEGSKQIEQELSEHLGIKKKN